ncbi:MAG: hypothetical protein GTO03_02070, partial [Planctomycetales bacterium]|nr:hypothetical protein [Planctomycetales bacterium]
MVTPVTRQPARHDLQAAGVVILAILTLAGCGEAGSPPDQAAQPGAVPSDTSPPPAVAADAAQILRRMIERYQAATTYSDSAVVRLDLKTSQGDQQQEFPIAVSFARPNRLLFTRDDVLVLSDGQKLYGRVLSLADQVVVARAPQTITIPAFYEIQVISPLMMQPGLEGHSIQLDLLAAEQPLQELRQDNLPSRVLPPAVCADRSCDRLGFQTDAGEIVFWIDQENSLLRKLEFPTEELRKSMGAEVSEVTLVAEFRDAQLDG